MTLCVTQAIELALYATIMEGSLKGYWGFEDQAAQTKLTEEYLKTRGTAPVRGSAVRQRLTTYPVARTPCTSTGS